MQKAARRLVQATRHEAPSLPGCNIVVCSEAHFQFKGSRRARVCAAAGAGDMPYMPCLAEVNLIAPSNAGCWL